MSESSSYPFKTSSLKGVRPRPDTSRIELDLAADRPKLGRAKKTRILIVEDSDDHSELLLRQLRKSHLDGHVKIIGDGQEAWDFLVQDCRCDELIAIFLDLHLPTLDGLQLLRRIRENPLLSSISVVVISSSDNPEDRAVCRTLNVSAFVNKPVSFSTFSKSVADVFHSTDTRQLTRPE